MKGSPFSSICQVSVVLRRERSWNKGGEGRRVERLERAPWRRWRPSKSSVGGAGEGVIAEVACAKAWGHVGAGWGGWCQTS